MKQDRDSCGERKVLFTFLPKGDKKTTKTDGYPHNAGENDQIRFGATLGSGGTPYWPRSAIAAQYVEHGT